jgi:hypothetical protein
MCGFCQARCERLVDIEKLSTRSCEPPGNGEEPEGEVKPFGIAKRVVWEAHRQVKANQGAAGIDRSALMQRLPLPRLPARRPRRVNSWSGTWSKRTFLDASLASAR